MSLAPSQAEIDRIRSDAESLLTGTCRLLTPTRVFDPNAGGHVEYWAQSEEIACNFAPLSDRSQGGITGGRISEETTHVFTLPYSVEIGLESRIVCEGGQWVVTAIPDRVSGYLFVRRVEARLAPDTVEVGEPPEPEPDPGPGEDEEE